MCRLKERKTEKIGWKGRIERDRKGGRIVMDSLLASRGQMYNLACEPAPSLYFPPLARHVTHQMAGRVCTSMSPWLPQNEGGSKRSSLYWPLWWSCWPQTLEQSLKHSWPPCSQSIGCVVERRGGVRERKQMGHVIAGRVQLRQDPEEGAKGERRLVGGRAPLICSRRGHGELFPSLQ